MTASTTESVMRAIAATEAEPGVEGAPERKRLALVASKGGLDEVYPVLIMASTAGALGWEVGVFCTFYGLEMVNTKRNNPFRLQQSATRRRRLPLTAYR